MIVLSTVIGCTYGLCNMVLWAGNVRIWVAFAIVIIINVTIMTIMDPDNTSGCSWCNDVEKTTIIIIENTKNITYIYWQYLWVIIMW